VVEVEDLTGEDATADAVKKRLAARRWDVLHYAGHGGWAADRATGSGLLLADRLFTAADLADLPMPPLVVFNACSTSRFTPAPAAATSPIEPAVAGPSLASFVLTAGVQAFVGTSWPVADDAAERFSTTLYDQLVGGARLDDALLTARRSLQSTSDWGAYTLYGDSALRF
jgi:CHAT domain-containing protein